MRERGGGPERGSRWGVPMSRVNFKKWPCSLSLTKIIPEFSIRAQKTKALISRGVFMAASDNGEFVISCTKSGSGRARIPCCILGFCMFGSGQILLCHFSGSGQMCLWKFGLLCV